MAKLILDQVLVSPNPFVKINENNQRIVDAIENTVSRDGTTPNHMEADLDLNGYNILNQGNPFTLASFNWRGGWATDKVYGVGDTISFNGVSYINLVQHTSTTFQAALDLGYWDVVAGIVGTLPEQTGQDGKYLRTNAGAPGWVDIIPLFDAAGAATTAVASLDAQLATVAKSGDYNNLINTPFIPSAQVNADWDASSGVSQILNKPVITSFAESILDDVSSSDVRTTIGAVGVTGNETISGNKTFTGSIDTQGGVIGKLGSYTPAAGEVGEIVTTTATGIVVPINGTPVNITSAVFGSGFWIIDGKFSLIPTGGTLDVVFGSLSQTSGVDDLNHIVKINSTIGSGSNIHLPTSVSVFKFTTTTTVYLVVGAVSTGGSLAGAGNITGIRIL